MAHRSELISLLAFNFSDALSFTDNREKAKFRTFTDNSFTQMLAFVHVLEFLLLWRDINYDHSKSDKEKHLIEW